MRNLTSNQSGTNNSDSSLPNNPFENDASSASSSSSSSNGIAIGGNSQYHPVPSSDDLYRSHLPPQPPQRNPFISDSNSDNASLASDQFIFSNAPNNPSSSGTNPSSRYQTHYSNDDYYNNVNNDPTNSSANNSSRQLNSQQQPASSLSQNQNYLDFSDGNPSYNSIAAHTSVAAAAVTGGVALSSNNNTQDTIVNHENSATAILGNNTNPEASRSNVSPVAISGSDYHSTQQSHPYNMYNTQNDNSNNNNSSSASSSNSLQPHQQQQYNMDQNLHAQQYPPYGGASSSEGISIAAAGHAAAVGTGTSSSLLAPPSSQPSSSSLSAMAGSANAMSSAEFDRYPNRISSAAPSIASGSGAPLLMRDAYPQHLNAHNNHMAMGGGPNSTGGNGRSSTISNESGSSSFSDTDSASYAAASANPFIVNSDFSPFGGYPASSFPLHMEEKEADDYLHNPDPILDAKYDRKCQKLDKRGWASMLALLFLVLGGLALFVVLPVLTYSGATEERRVITKEVELLTNYEYNILGAIRTSLIDPDTPSSAYNWTAMDGSSWPLVFSDEFNKEGRTFYDGEDQFWTAPDIHYAATRDLEWYDPDASITEGGTLNLRLDAFKNHDLFYRSGMVQSWNKLCFTQGKLEVSALLPGNGSILGLWPGIWTLGNLVRPGFLASAEGVWPYSYNECDIGITPNQSSTDGLSYLKGQRLNSCTCDGADHPNPGVGRGGPEIDALEGTVDSNLMAGVVSQSLQIAPYDIWYVPDINFIEVYNRTVSHLNPWNGGPLQQAVSMASALNATWYEVSDTPRYQKYGFEYLNDDNEGYIRWFVGDTPTFTMFAPALGPNGNVQSRPIAKEPMSIILNLGISNSWVYIDWPSLVWPSIMRIDYVRIYQPKNALNLGCDPSGYPTYDYIESHKDLYTNPNLTIFDDTVYEWPKNKLTGC